MQHTNKEPPKKNKKTSRHFSTWAPPHDDAKSCFAFSFNFLVLLGENSSSRSSPHTFSWVSKTCITGCQKHHTHTTNTHTTNTTLNKHILCVCVCVCVSTHIFLTKSTSASSRVWFVTTAVVQCPWGSKKKRMSPILPCVCCVFVLCRCATYIYVDI